MRAHRRDHALHAAASLANGKARALLDARIAGLRAHRRNCVLDAARRRDCALVATPLTGEAVEPFAPDFLHVCHVGMRAHRCDNAPNAAAISHAAIAVWRAVMCVPRRQINSDCIENKRTIDNQLMLYAVLILTATSPRSVTCHLGLEPARLLVRLRTVYLGTIADLEVAPVLRL